MDDKIEEGVVHTVPEDIKKALQDTNAISQWNALTPLARNEWICWTTIVKKAATRSKHVKRLCSEILDGKKRPCCWPGCPHRNPKNKSYFK